MDAPDRLKIAHVLRAPVGGVLRHVLDLAQAQSAAGHAVGVICDSLTGGAFEEQSLAAIADRLALGVSRIAMRRAVSPADLPSMLRVGRRLEALAPDVVHCHGAKGGVYGRLAAAWLDRKRPIACLYAPHGGSLHYHEGSLEGRVYFGIERFLERFTDVLVHVSAYEAETYRRKIGAPRCRAVVVPNGLRADEFTPVPPAPDARDFLFLGTFRELKGIDTFLQAIARLDAQFDRRASAYLVGQHEPADLDRYQALARSLGIGDRVVFHGPLPAREAFARGRAIVVPSRSESMPYVVLEAIAAGVPIVATKVGGIPEIFGPRADELVPPDDPEALAAALNDLLANPVRAQLDAAARFDWLRPRFNIEAMQRRIGTLYHDILDRKLRGRSGGGLLEPASLRAGMRGD